MDEFIIRSVAPKGRCLILSRAPGPGVDLADTRSALEERGWLVTDQVEYAVSGGKAFDVVLIEDPGAYPADFLALLREAGTLVVGLIGTFGLSAESIPHLDVFLCGHSVLTRPLRELGKASHFVAPGVDAAAKRVELVERHWTYRKEHGRYAQVDWSRISYGHTAISRDEVGAELAKSWQSPEIPARQRALVQSELEDMYRGNVPALFRVLADAVRPYVATGTGVLEIGCASGYYYEILEYLLNRNLFYCGVDYSAPLTAMARTFYPRTPFVTADGGRLPFPDGVFPVVISSGVLLHVPDYRAHIRETVRVADRVVVAHRVPLCRLRPTQFTKKFAYAVETVEIVFNEAEILQAFREEGMERVNLFEFSSNAGEDLYHATFVFERVAVPQPLRGDWERSRQAR